MFPLVMCIVALSKILNNAAGRNLCRPIPNNAPHCIGYEDGITPEGFHIPCGRGREGDNLLFLRVLNTAVLVMFCLPPGVIVGTMVLMHRSVSKIERKMRKYGVSTLRLKVSSKGKSAKNQGILNSIKSLCTGMIPCLGQPISRSNRVTSQKRAILYMALGYALAWLFAFVPIFVALADSSHKTDIAPNCLTPLQGFYNFLVYMSPKVRSAKRTKNKKLTWSQAFTKAWLSKGEERKMALRGSNASRASSWQQGLRRMLSRFPARHNPRSKKTTIGRTTTQSRPEDSAVKLPSSKHVDTSRSQEESTMREQELVVSDEIGKEEEEKCEERPSFFKRDKSMDCLAPNVERI